MRTSISLDVTRSRIPADLAVVEPDVLARLGLPEDLGKGAADPVVAAGGGGCGGFEAAGEGEVVAAVDTMGLLDLGQLADRDGVLLDSRRADELETGAHVSGLRRRHLATLGSHFDDDPVPDGAATVDQFESVTHTPTLEPARVVDWHDCHSWRHDSTSGVGGEPCERRHGHDPETVALRRDAYGTRTRLQRAGAQLRAAEVHRDAGPMAVRSLCCAYVVDHPLPELRSVVRAVDAGDVHSAHGHPGHEIRLLRRLGRERDHDPRPTLPCRRAQQLFGVRGEELASFGQCDPGSMRWWFATVQPGEHRQDLLGRRENVRFRPSERRQSCRGESRLEITDVVVTELEVVDEVRGRATVRRVGGRDVAGSRRLGCEHRVANDAKVGLQGLECITLARGGLHRVKPTKRE